VVGCLGNMFVGVWRVWNICVGWHGVVGCLGICLWVCGGCGTFLSDGMEWWNVWEICLWVCGGCGTFVSDGMEWWDVVGNMFVGVWRVWNIFVGWRMAGSGGMSGKYVCGCVEGVEHFVSDGMEWWDVWEICLWVCGGCGTFVSDGMEWWDVWEICLWVCGGGKIASVRENT
jgi:hypothetical protein